MTADAVTMPLLIVTTGGTIDKVYFDAKSDFEVGHSVVAELLRDAHVTLPFEIVEAMRKDSLDLLDADRRAIHDIVAGHDASSVVITHGTDTMTTTAAALHDLALTRTIVFTGALSPARFARSDATFNVGMAIATAQVAPPGCYLVMNGQVFDAAKVVKDRPNNRFVSR